MRRQGKAGRGWWLLLVLLLLAPGRAPAADGKGPDAAASPPAPAEASTAPAEEPAAPAGVSLAPDDVSEAAEIRDPLEGMNRRIFWFNEHVDRYFIEPVSEVWDFLLPNAFQRGLRNAFDNAQFPVIFLNDLLQAKPGAAAHDLGRFLVNTTAGVGGVWDAARLVGLEGHDEDFGQTLGYWGVPQGPYLVLPFLGPSNPRDAVGLAADSAARVYPYFVAFWISYAVTGTDLLNRRSLLIEEIRENRRSALDYYAFVRNAYVNYRRNLVEDAKEKPKETSGDLYYPSDDEEYP